MSMLQETETCIIIEPHEPVTSAVIWLHGLGANGHDFVPVVKELGLPELGMRAILPHAPEMPVTINGGYVMPAWYDILGMDLQQQQDAGGIRQSAAFLNDLIESQLDSGIGAGRLLLAGFSQGGAIVLHAGLRSTRPLGGILALSTYLPLPDDLPGDITDTAKQIPVFMGHGLHDTVVPITAGEKTRDLLKAQGLSVDWHSYPMEHSVSMDEIADIGSWIERQMF